MGATPAVADPGVGRPAPRCRRATPLEHDRHRRLRGLPAGRRRRCRRALARRSARLEPEHLAGPGRPQLRRDHRGHQLARRPASIPTSARTTPYGIPYEVVGARRKRVKVKFTAYGSESDHGKYRIPLNAGIEGGKNADGDRHVLAYDKERLQALRALQRLPLPKKNRWKADGGAIWDLTQRRAADRGLDLRRRRRAADLPRPRPLRRGRRGRLNHAIRMTFESPATPGSTRPRTAPATPTRPASRRWARGCGSRSATTSPASPAAPGDRRGDEDATG